MNQAISTDRFTPEELDWYNKQRRKQLKITSYTDAVDIINNTPFEDTTKIRSKRRKVLSLLPADYKRYLLSANSRGLSFELTVAQFNTIISKPCTYCGNDRKPGIDRRDNKIGYTLVNSQPCCGKCNMAKYKSSHEEFIQHLSRIFHHLRSLDF